MARYYWGFIWFLALAFVGSEVVLAGGAIVGKVQAGKQRYQANTLVYIEYVEGEFSPPTEPVIMDQKDLKFVPHVLPILAGTTVDFINSDDVLHNVFTPDKCGGKFNLGSWPKGEKRSHRFPKSSCSSVMLCNVHPEMEAFIIILQNPYYAVTDSEGAFKIEDIPTGNYVLKVWNERLKAELVKVTVIEGEQTEVNFTLKR